MSFQGTAAAYSRTAVPAPQYSHGGVRGQAASSALSGCACFFETEPILLRFWFFGELEEVSGDVLEGVSDLCGGCVEELAPRIDAVDAFGCEAVVKLGFDSHCIVGEEQGVDIEVEWHGRVSELADAVHGVEAACHADLDHPFAERPDVRDDVDIACTDIGLALLDVVDPLFNFDDLLLEARSFGFVTDFFDRLEDVEVVLPFLFEAFPLGLEFSLRFCLLSQFCFAFFFQLSFSAALL